jgi:hypothetical protein
LTKINLVEVRKMGNKDYSILPIWID